MTLAYVIFFVYLCAQIGTRYAVIAHFAQYDDFYGTG